MSSCTLAVSDTKKLFEASKRRAEALMETMKVTSEGEVLSETLATANRAIELLNNRDFDNLSEVNRGGLTRTIAAVVARGYLKDVFKGSIMPGANMHSARQDLVMQSVEYSDDKVKVRVSPKGKQKYWTYSFGPRQNQSETTDASGSKLYIPGFDHVFSRIEDAVREANGVMSTQDHAKASNSGIDAMYADTGFKRKNTNRLGSAADMAAAFNYKTADVVHHQVHSSRAYKKHLLADLHARTDNTIDSKTFDYYNTVLDKMHDHFFHDMNVYINENADHAQGWVDLDKNHILLNMSSKTRDGMSNEEVYMHELIHAMTAWGLKQKGFKASRLQARLNRLHSTARSNITWRHIAKANRNLTEKQAKERYDYIFDSENSDEEFLAFALTNPELMTQMENIKVKDHREKGFFNGLLDFFGDLMDAVMGNFDWSNRNGSLKNEIHTLAFKLAEINNEANQRASEGNMFTKAADFVTMLEGRFEEVATKMTDALDSTSNVDIPVDPNPVQKALFIVKFFAKGVYNRNYRHAVGVMLTHYGIKPTSSIREIVRNLLPTLDDSHYEAQREGLKSASIDNVRNLHNTVSAKSIIDGFDRKLTEEEEIALTGALLESNGSVLFKKNKNLGKGYTTKQIANLLSDAGMRKRTMARVEHQVKKRAGHRGNWVVGQANGLGKLMATGKGHEAQVTNSKSIVLGYGSSERFKLDKNLLAMVEELAALRALDYQNQTELNTTANLLIAEEKGVRNVVNLYSSFREVSEEALFADDPAHMMEGYVKELFDDTIEVRYEKLEDKESLEKQGYALVSEVDNNGLKGGTKLGIFVSKSFTRAERLRGSVGLGTPQSRGLTLRDIRYRQYGENKKHAQVYFEADKIALNKKAIEINKQLSAGTSFDAIEEGAVPILNATGKTVDYRNMMDKHLKAKFLKQDRTVSRVLSRTSGSVVDKVARAEQNKDVLDLIRKNLKENYDNVNSKDNLEEHTLVGPDHSDPDIRRLYNMLPQTYRDFARSRADGVLPIPSVLMHQYFGYTHYRFTDAPGINRLPEAVKHILNMFEAYWMDFVKIVKGNVLLKMPIVLVTNVVSNIFFAINTGSNPFELIGQYRDSIRDVKDFMKAHKEVQKLTIELASVSQDYMNIDFSASELEAHNEKVATLQKKIKRLEKEMEKNEVKELFDIGMYQSVIEDIEMYKLGDSNKVSDGMDKLTSKLPTMIRTPLQIAYLSKETAWYKVNQEVLQLSDLVARDVMNRKQKMIEKKQANGEMDLPVEYRKLIGRMSPRRVTGGLKGAEREKFFEIAERSRHATLLDSFVNYQLPNGRGEEYLNRVGLLMFTKYLKRIQRVITTTGIKHPIRTTAMLAATAFMLDVDTIQDMSLMVKATDDSDSGLLGIVPLYGPLDILMTGVMPPLVQLLTP